MLEHDDDYGWADELVEVRDGGELCERRVRPVFQDADGTRWANARTHLGAPLQRFRVEVGLHSGVRYMSLDRPIASYPGTGRR